MTSSYNAATFTDILDKLKRELKIGEYAPASTSPNSGDVTIPIINPNPDDTPQNPRFDEIALNAVNQTHDLKTAAGTATSSMKSKYNTDYSNVTSGVTDINTSTFNKNQWSPIGGFDSPDALKYNKTPLSINQSTAVKGGSALGIRSARTPMQKNQLASGTNRLSRDKKFQNTTLNI